MKKKQRRKSRQKLGIVGNGTKITISAASLAGKPFVADYLYILGADGRTPHLSTDLIAWAKQLEDVQKRRVATDRFYFQNKTSGMKVEYFVSTVFTGTATNMFVEDVLQAPEVFETLVSRIDTDSSGEVAHEEQEIQCHWTSWEQAAGGHDGILIEIYHNHSGLNATFVLPEFYRPEGSVESPLGSGKLEMRGEGSGIVLPMDKLRKLLEARIIKS